MGLLLNQLKELASTLVTMNKKGRGISIASKKSFSILLFRISQILGRIKTEQSLLCKMFYQKRKNSVLFSMDIYEYN